MATGIDPMIDIVFKKLFGSVENKDLLLDLVNSVLGSAGEERIVDLEILNPYNQKNWLRDKLSIVDIKAQSESGDWFIIEVQVQMSWYFTKRLLYYWARIYQSRLKESERYNLLKKVTVIAFTKEPLPLATEHYRNHFRVLEVKSGVPLCDDLNIHTIELARFDLVLETLQDNLARWTYFLKHGENLNESDIPTQIQTPAIRHAVKELVMFTQDDIQREIYESRRKAAMDKASADFEVYDSGMRKGEEEARKQTVINALQMGLAIDAIEKLTGLSPQFIRDIQEKLKNT